jgi:hypothetical protein
MYLTLNHCIYVFEFFRKILIGIQKDFDELELTNKESLIYDSKESKSKPHNQEISGQPCNQKTPRN